MKSNRYFPTRLFRWFLTKQIVLAAISLVFLDFFILLWLEYAHLDDVTLRLGRQIVLYTLISASLVLVAVSLVMARQLVVPLGRLIEKARHLHRFPFEEDLSTDSSFAYDEPGEWYDLERALNELGRDLRQKTIRLSREKTELRTIMTAMNEAVLAISQDRKVLFYNPHFAVMFSMDPSKSSELSVNEILRSPDILQAYQICLNDGVVVRREVRLEMKGGVRTFQLSVAPLRKKHNQEIYGAVAVFHDVTDFKKAEVIRSEFVGNVSHELRTPLTSIRGYLQTAIEDIRLGRSEESLEFLNIVSRNVDRLMFLVNDLLDLSSLQSGVELRRHSVALEPLTESVLNQVDCRQHKVRVEFGIKKLEADEGRIEQVLRNLLQNAVRYVPAGGSIEVRWLETPTGAELRVKDNGPGIAKEHQARLFERFYRVDEARARNVGGSGIGLALVKHIVQGHGGDVQVVSEPGKGAEFICTFPR